MSIADVVASVSPHKGDDKTQGSRFDHVAEVETLKQRLRPLLDMLGSELVSLMSEVKELFDTLGEVAAEEECYKSTLPVLKLRYEALEQLVRSDQAGWEMAEERDCQ